MKHAFSRMITIIIRLLAYLVSTFVKSKFDSLLSTDLEIVVEEKDVRLTLRDENKTVLTLIKMK